MAGNGTAATTRRPRRGLRLALGLFALVLVAGGVWAAVGFLTLTSSESRQTFAFGGDRLVIDADGNTVRVTAGRPGVIEVDRHLKNDSLRKPRPAERLRGETLTLRGGCPHSGVEVFCEARYDLRVPSDLDLRVVNHSGGVHASGLAGPLDLRGDNGGITVDGAVQPLRLHTSDGAIRAGGLRSTDVQASTDNSGITLSFLVAPDRVDASTSNGSIGVTVPAGSGPYHVQQQTSNGRTGIDVPTDAAAARDLVLRTSNGSIAVRPAGR